MTHRRRLRQFPLRLQLRLHWQRLRWRQQRPPTATRDGLQKEAHSNTSEQLAQKQPSHSERGHGRSASRPPLRRNSGGSRSAGTDRPIQTKASDEKVTSKEKRAQQRDARAAKPWPLSKTGSRLCGLASPKRLMQCQSASRHPLTRSHDAPVFMAASAGVRARCRFLPQAREVLCASCPRALQSPVSSPARSVSAACIPLWLPRSLPPPPGFCSASSLLSVCLCSALSRRRFSLPRLLSVRLMSTESTSLLRGAPSVNGGGSGRGSVSGPEGGVGLINRALSRASTSPLLAAHRITLEDHRPGRPTTFSLLSATPVAEGSGERGVAPILTAHAHSHAQLHSQDSAAGGSPQEESTSPYQFGDGGRGYNVLFPAEEDESQDPAVAAASAARNEAAAASIARHVSVAISLSLGINVILFVTKTYSAIASGSLSVAASAVDSFLDLASQCIVWLAERGSKNHDSSLYPAGRSRLEPVGIILCAAIMGCASLQLILESVGELAQGYGAAHVTPTVSFDVFTLSLLLATVMAKLGLWIYCAAFAKHSPTLYTLAVDHRNDVMSNLVALLAALVAWRWSAAWSADPIGAILMSVYICINWSSIALEQIDHIVGRAADPDFLESVRTLSSSFHEQLIPDIIRAYHFGARYLVELEVILPAAMTVREAHDISLALQQSVEQLSAVERCFVHVDWKGRDVDEHDAAEIKSKLQKRPIEQIA